MELENFRLVIELGTIYTIILLLTTLYLRRNGFDVPLFVGSISNLNLIFKVTHKYKSRKVRILHFFLYLYLVFFPIAWVIIFFVTAFDDNFITCKQIESFKQKEYYGTVVEKYVDSENHLSQTIILKNNDSIFQIYDFNNLFNIYFESVKVGDSIIKNFGERNIYFIRDSIKGTFVLYKECDYKKYEKKVEEN